MKRFILTLACLFVMVGTANAASREVTAGLVQGVGPDVTLFEVINAGADAVPECLRINSDATDSTACNDFEDTVYVAPRNMKVNNLRVVVSEQGDAASTCDLKIQIGAADAGTELTAFSVVVAGVVFNQAQNFVISEGDAIGFEVIDDSGCISTEAIRLTVSLEGQFLN